MKIEQCTVHDQHGLPIPAQMIRCEKCNGMTFLLFVVNGHDHMQCDGCGVSYCKAGGACSQ